MNILKIGEQSLMTDKNYLLKFDIDTDLALDILYDQVDSLILDGKLDEVDNLLINVDVTKTPRIILIGYLTITLPVRNNLKTRRDFYDRVFRKLALDDEESSKTVYKLLNGLA